jgi:tetratricopeptide (TPR) repeat protein
MTFEEILDQAVAMLQRRGRLTYGALKRQFQLDDAYLDDLKAELIEGQRVAVDEDGRVLVWTGAEISALHPTAPPVSSQDRLPLAYTPPYLAEKILTAKSTLESMMDAVHRYEGTVNQVMGDGIMALFGAPLAHEDHALRACYAALAMQAALRRYAEEVHRAHGLEMQIRVGLHSGDVVVRAISNDLHMDYSAIGRTTHLAARMEQLATPGSILLTTETLRLVEGVVQVKALGATPVKGLRHPLEVFELVGAGPPRTHLQAFAARALTRFVGRQAELEAIRHALEQAGEGHGQLVAIIGEPGVGKTRLFYEFLCAPWPQGWLLLESQAASYGQATPYHPVRELLNAYFQLEGRDDEERRREKVTSKLGTLDPALAPILPAVLALLDVPVDDRAWQALDPSQRRQRTLDALKRLVLRESQVQPVLLVCESLHWIDTETQAFLDSLVESLPTARLLLLVNYRPEYQHSWDCKTYYAQLRLDPLPSATTDELLQALLGDDPSLAPLTPLLMARTAGNPFFLEESVRTLVGEPGAYRLEQPLHTLYVPATVQAVLAARIDRLPLEEKHVLQTAAVIGTEVPLPLLQAIAERPEADLRRGLAHLQAAEFLYETRLFPEREFTFKHALTHEVAYNGLLQERRRVLHARIVEALEALAGDRVTEQVERLAHHAMRGAVWDKALAYNRQAGARVVARSAYREAVACFEQALAALAQLPECRDTLEQAIDLRFELRNALIPLGEQARIFDYLWEAEVLAERLGDNQRLGRIANYLCIAFSNMGEHDRAIAAGQQALALATASGAFDIQVVAQTYLGLAYTAVGDFRRALDFSRRVMALLTGEQRFTHFGQTNPPAVVSRVFAIWNLAELGGFAEGRGVGEDAVQIAEAVEQPYSLATALIVIGLLYRRQGDIAKAISTLERALALCQSANISRFFPRIASPLVAAYALAGRAAEALPFLDQMLERVAIGSRIADLALVLTELSEALLLVDRVDEASALAERLFELSRTHTGRGYQAHAYRLLGEVAMRRAPPDIDQATAHYCQALALAEALGMRPLQAHCHLGLGILYVRTGQRQQAHAALSAAIDLYWAMDMTFWLPQAEAALAQVEEE